MSETDTITQGLYGHPPSGLAEPAPGAIQLSPLVPGAQSLEDAPTLGGLTMLAPPGAVERRYALAMSLRALRPGAPVTVLAPKDRGGSRLRKELEGFGCSVEEEARRHHRICHFRSPDAPEGLDAAIAEGAPRLAPDLGLWTQPGVFSWDRIDPGSRLLADTLIPPAGEGADFGCGVGYLAQAVLAAPKVSRLHLIDIDGRAVECARRNVDDARADIVWDDARASGLTDLDFVVMNPPFHDAGTEDRGLGQAFIQAAARALRRGGSLWMVANRHLPYERVLNEAFKSVAVKAESSGYKVFEARK